MTKTELIDKMDIACENGTSHRLFTCKAWWVEDTESGASALVSYHTLVAVYYRGVVWEFYRYSNTTTQHVHKFARLMDAHVVSLYRRSGMRLSDFWLHEKYDWQDVIDAVLST